MSQLLSKSGIRGWRVPSTTSGSRLGSSPSTGSVLCMSVLCLFCRPCRLLQRHLPQCHKCTRMRFLNHREIPNLRRRPSTHCCRHGRQAPRAPLRQLSPGGWLWVGHDRSAPPGHGCVQTSHPASISQISWQFLAVFGASLANSQSYWCWFWSIA